MANSLWQREKGMKKINITSFQVWTLGLRVCDDASLSEIGGMHMVLKKVNSKMKKVSGSAAQTCFFFFYLYLGF